MGDLISKLGGMISDGIGGILGYKTGQKSASYIENKMRKRGPRNRGKQVHSNAYKFMHCMRLVTAMHAVQCMCMCLLLCSDVINKNGVIIVNQ